MNTPQPPIEPVLACDIDCLVVGKEARFLLIPLDGTDHSGLERIAELNGFAHCGVLSYCTQRDTFKATALGPMESVTLVAATTTFWNHVTAKLRERVRDIQQTDEYQLEKMALLEDPRV
jgi:hypothetical protein